MDHQFVNIFNNDFKKAQKIFIELFRCQYANLGKNIYNGSRNNQFIIIIIISVSNY